MSPRYRASYDHGCREVSGGPGGREGVECWSTIVQYIHTIGVMEGCGGGNLLVKSKLLPHLVPRRTTNNNNKQQQQQHVIPKVAIRPMNTEYPRPTKLDNRPNGY